jgi:hypothetical protein
MRRTTKKERTENARLFNTMLCSSYSNQGAIVVERNDSTNPCISRTRFIACVAYGAPIVIAESTQGIQGCWMEYFKSIGYEGKQTEYYHDNFHDWIYKEFQYKITYKDGLVFMITCGTEEE